MTFYVHPLETDANLAGAVLENAECCRRRDNQDCEGGLNGPDGFFFTDPEPNPEPRKVVSTIIPRYLAYD